MKRNGLIARAAVGAFGGLMLIGAAGAAVAAEVGDDEVGVDVVITPPAPTGALTMTVAASSATLTEDPGAATAAHRVFTGTLPTVTVTDDRSQVPAGTYWYVNGQSSDLTSTGTADVIGADRLGWTPNLLTPDNGEVAEGGETVPSVDTPTSPGNNVGLASSELLALALDSGEARAQGTWSADAALKLKTDATTAPGAYSGTITLTLWEDTLQP